MIRLAESDGEPPVDAIPAYLSVKLKFEEFVAEWK